LKLTKRADRDTDRIADMQAAGLALLILALATIFFEPSWGIPLLVAAGLALSVPVIRRP